MFQDVRRQVLPAIVQQKYTEARAAFDGKDFSAAQDGFKQVLDLLADSDLGSAANRPPLSELRTLALGFRDLSTTASAPPRPLARPLPQGLAPPVLAPPPRPAASQIHSADAPNIVPPIVVRQSFAPLADVFALQQGVVEVVIDETGAVVETTMKVSVNAVYDRVALATAKSWRYKPATLNGVPVKYRKTILLDVKSTR